MELMAYVRIDRMPGDKIAFLVTYIRIDGKLEKSEISIFGWLM